MSNSILHYAQTALLTSTAALCLALIVIDAQLMKFAFKDPGIDDQFYLIDQSPDGVVTRYLAWWYNHHSIDRSYYALMVIGSVGLFVSCTALAVLCGLRRTKLKLSFIRGKNSLPLHSAPFIILSIAILIPGVIVTMVMSFIDNRDPWLEPICEYEMSDFYNQTGYNYCNSYAPLTVEQWTCHLAHDTLSYDGARIDRPNDASQWCTNSRFARWVTVPLFGLMMFSILVAILQLCKRNRDAQNPFRDPLFTKSPESRESLIAPSSSSGIKSYGSHSSRIPAMKRGSTEIMSSPVSEISDNPLRIPIELKGTTFLPVEKGDDRKRSIEVPESSNSRATVHEELPKVSYI